MRESLAQAFNIQPDSALQEISRGYHYNCPKPKVPEGETADGQPLFDTPKRASPLLAAAAPSAPNEVQSKGPVVQEARTPDDVRRVVLDHAMPTTSQERK